MIAGVFHQGSGLGDQLFRYITVRTIADEKGVGFGMLNPKWFKGGSFLNLDMGDEVLELEHAWNEKDVRDKNGVDIRSYDPEINFVKDNTIIDGSFEDSKYWHHNLQKIENWLSVEPLFVPDNVCVIGFRGGEYTADPDLFLPAKYWGTAIARMLEIDSHMVFQVHTDDPVTARQVFPFYEIIENQQLSHSKHANMGLNWRAMRHAKYAIIANSSFYIMPRQLRHREEGAVTVAPRYWARRNTGAWARPACYYREFSYL